MVPRLKSYSHHTCVVWYNILCVSLPPPAVWMDGCTPACARTTYNERVLVSISTRSSTAVPRSTCFMYRFFGRFVTAYTHIIMMGCYTSAQPCALCLSEDLPPSLRRRLARRRPVIVCCLDVGPRGVEWFRLAPHYSVAVVQILLPYTTCNEHTAVYELRDYRVCWAVCVSWFVLTILCAGSGGPYGSPVSSGTRWQVCL